MTIDFVVVLTVGLLAAIGLIGIFAGAARAGKPGGRRSFRIGSVAMTLAGLLLMLASIVGLVGADQLFGGLMMLIFGTAIGLPAAKSSMSDAAVRGSI